ncbi:hypothetical protein A5707_01220 [Mycobacterium kyorinense]|uniref:Uncharacterized protein n=1 Tax=Mycobacterium kyorinense TaxID=487514 RepID=A0A1A2ZEK3_9MYCO|nr:hypothetical protein A5707_01220 [Mycobacterium kyorinense]
MTARVSTQGRQHLVGRHPDEIFSVTENLIANWEKYARIASHTIPFDRIGEAMEAASTPAPPTN